MEATLLAVILTAVLSASANNISEQCKVHNERITCTCVGNKELFLPDDHNYRNISSISIAKCAKVNLHYNSLWRASKLEEIIVENVNDHLDFDVSIESSELKLLRLSNISRIPVIPSHTFTTLKTIDRFIIENVFIEDFQEDFNFVNVSQFVLTNVVIERVNKLNFEKGTTLRIANSEFHNVISSQNIVKFRNVEIVDSKIEQHTPGTVFIHGDTTVVRNSFFSNVSLSLDAKESITINGICADGKSTLRIMSKVINSTNNRIPNEITYLNDYQPKFLVNKNNTVCKAGNCDCRPKSSGQAQSRIVMPMLIIECLLMPLSLLLFGS